MSPFSAQDLRAVAVVTSHVPVSLHSLSWCANLLAAGCSEPSYELLQSPAETSGFPTPFEDQLRVRPVFDLESDLICSLSSPSHLPCLLLVWFVSRCVDFFF